MSGGVVIYNCKRCKVGKRIAYPHAERNGRYSVWRYRLHEHTGARVYPGRNSGDELCPQCRRPMNWKFLEAHAVPGVPCDARCTGARGHRCECSCGGRNHGADRSVATEGTTP
jgi:hypothetical protein